MNANNLWKRLVRSTTNDAVETAMYLTDLRKARKINSDITGEITFQSSFQKDFFLNGAIIDYGHLVAVDGLVGSFLHLYQRGLNQLPLGGIFEIALEMDRSVFVKTSAELLATIPDKESDQPL